MKNINAILFSTQGYLKYDLCGICSECKSIVKLLKFSPYTRLSLISTRTHAHTHTYKEKMSENNKYGVKAYRTPNTQFIEHLLVGARIRPSPTVNKICISSACDISEHSTDKPFSSHTQLHLRNMLAKLCELVESSMLEHIYQNTKSLYCHILLLLCDNGSLNIYRI